MNARESGQAKPLAEKGAKLSDFELVTPLQIKGEFQFHRSYAKALAPSTF